MGLIVFVWFFVIFLLVSTLYAFSVKNTFAKSLMLCSFSSFLATFALVSLLHILYSFYDIDTSILTKIYLILLLCSSAFMLQFALDFPLFEKRKKLPLIFNLVYHALGLVVILFYIEEFYWNALYVFKISSVDIFGFPAIRSLVYAYVFLPGVVMAIL